jgi:hypothetical protein
MKSRRELEILNNWKLLPFGDWGGSRDHHDQRHRHRHQYTQRCELSISNFESNPMPEKWSEMGCENWVRQDAAEHHRSVHRHHKITCILARASIKIDLIGYSR